jgi:hypothetical protein
LDFFCGGIMSFLSAETMVAPMLGVRKSDGSPEHKIPEWSQESVKKRGDKVSPEVWLHLKSCESLYMCPRTPFYREAKGLLHSEIVLESKEYSKCEHVQECLLHLVICGDNFTYLRVSHQFTPWTRTFEAMSLTWSLLYLRPFIHENHHSQGYLKWVSASTAEVELSKFLPPWNKKQTCDPVLIRQLFRTTLGG